MTDAGLPEADRKVYAVYQFLSSAGSRATYSRARGPDPDVGGWLARGFEDERVRVMYQVSIITKD